jgi:hypothetical protein
MRLSASSRRCCIERTSSSHSSRQLIIAQSNVSELLFAAELGIKTLLSPASFGGLRGMAAAEDIAKETVICSVPRGSSIVLTPKMKNPCPDFIHSDYWNSLTPFYARMALMLLYQVGVLHQMGYTNL